MEIILVMFLFLIQIISGVSTWTHKATIAGDNTNDGLGYSSAISGNGSTILVGAIKVSNNLRGYYKFIDGMELQLHKLLK